MANDKTPAAPKHLPEDVQEQWQATYEKALAAAKKDTNDARAQQRAATKAANQLLAVSEPKSAVDIDKLDDWQVMDGSRKTLTRKDGSQVKVCVTTDGRKYSFPVAVAKPSKAAKPTAETAAQ